MDKLTFQFNEKFKASVLAALSKSDCVLINATALPYDHAQWIVEGPAISLFLFTYQLGKFKVPSIKFTIHEPLVIF